MKNIDLHPTLVKDCIMVGTLAASILLLMNDRHYPWLVLVPNRPGLRDFDDLSANDASMVHADIRQASNLLRTLFKPTKINVAALGNVVPQLHIHVIARFESDRAWPKPVWGVFPPEPYPEDQRHSLVARIKNMLDENNIQSG
ncbi:MAG: HIT family protein [Magnetococcales bacterium]|nr:HIT family protein [Magnetococcales bacterium]